MHVSQGGQGTGRVSGIRPGRAVTQAGVRSCALARGLPGGGEPRKFSCSRADRTVRYSQEVSDIKGYRHIYIHRALQHRDRPAWRGEAGFAEETPGHTRDTLFFPTSHSTFAKVLPRKAFLRI